MAANMNYTGFSLGFFWVVQHHLDYLVHHLDYNGMQLCTTWIQKVIDSWESENSGLEH